MEQKEMFIRSEEKRYCAYVLLKEISDGKDVGTHYWSKFPKINSVVDL